MTEQLAALAALGQAQAPAFAAALADFHQRHRQHALVLDKWFAVQASTWHAEALQTVRTLYHQHPDFDRNNPNRLRALVGGFANRNVAAFHREDGAGYAFLVEVIAALDPQNPTLAARFLQPFAGWRRLTANLQAAVRRELAKLRALPTLSTNTREMLERTLGD
jgi:aminopeptidase N